MAEHSSCAIKLGHHGLLIIISFIMMLQACDTSTKSQSSSPSPPITSTFRKDSANTYDFTLNNPGDASDVDISFPSLDQALSEDADAVDYFTVDSDTTSICTVSENSSNDGYQVNFIATSGDCELSLFSTIKETTNSSGEIQFSATDRSTETYSYTNDGYLVMGSDGDYDNNNQNSAYFYKDGSFQSTSNDSLSSIYALVTANNGKVYAGGVGLTSNNNLAVYDPSTSSWSSIDTTGLGDIYSLATDSNGKVYAGTPVDGTLHIYDPSTSTWSSTENTDLDDVFSMTTGKDGKIYAASLGNGNVAVYDPSTESWGDTITGLSQVDGISTSSDGKIYAATEGNSLYVYDPDDSSAGWTQTSSSTLISLITTVKAGNNGIMYAASFVPNADVAIYNPDDDSWTYIIDNDIGGGVWGGLIIGTDSTVYIGSLDPEAGFNTYDPINGWGTAISPNVDYIGTFTFFNLLTISQTS